MKNNVSKYSSVWAMHRFLRNEQIILYVLLKTNILLRKYSEPVKGFQLFNTGYFLK